MDSRITEEDRLKWERLKKKLFQQDQKVEKAFEETLDNLRKTMSWEDEAEDYWHGFTKGAIAVGSVLHPHYGNHLLFSVGLVAAIKFGLSNLKEAQERN